MGYIPPPPPRSPEWMSMSCMGTRDVVKNICHMPDGSVIYDILVPRTGWFGRLFLLYKYETRIDAGENVDIPDYYCGSVK